MVMGDLIWWETNLVVEMSKSASVGSNEVPDEICLSVVLMFRV